MIPPLPATALRWRCDPESLPFETTSEVEVIRGVVGQDAAVEALRFGLECRAAGQNVFIRGLTGTGRMTLVRHLLEELEPARRTYRAHCYVHNFSEPDRPRRITLPAETVKTFKRRMRELAELIGEHLFEVLDAAPFKAEREAIEARRQEEVEALTHGFEQELAAAGMELVTVQRGPVAIPAILSVVGGKPVPPEEFERLHQAGEVDDALYEEHRERRRTFQKRLSDVAARARELQRLSIEAIRGKTEQAARQILGELVGPLRAEFPSEDVGRFLDEVTEDVVENRLFSQGDGAFDPSRLYGVNVLLEHEDGGEVPIVVENTPTLAQLLGTVEREWGPQGPLPSDYRTLRAGSLLRADGGYLILDARDVLTEPGAWKVLVRTLRTGFLELVPPELGWSFWLPAIHPEPIPVELRVILVGDAWTYRLLDRYDADFHHLFKVLADFDSVIDRATEEDPRAGARHYAGVMSRVAREEGLPPFHRSAVAALVEHGARAASYRGKLTAKFGRIADIAREAAYLATKEGHEQVESSHVDGAIRRTKERAELPSRRFRELVRDGTLHVVTT